MPPVFRWDITRREQFAWKELEWAKSLRPASLKRVSAQRVARNGWKRSLAASGAFALGIARHSAADAYSHESTAIDGKAMPTSRKPSSDAADAVRKVRTYIAALPPKTRAEVRKLRATIRTAAPAAVEGFSYGIPGFRLNGRPLVWYAGWARHTSMYPVSPGVRRALGDQVER